jgi:hypothetical protein
MSSDILSLLEAHASEYQISSRHAKISVPSSGTMASLWPNARHVLVVSQGYQAQIHDVTQAQKMALSLLLVHHIPGGKDHETTSTIVASPATRIWAVDCCRRVLNCCKSFYNGPSSDSDCVFSGVYHVAFLISPVQTPKCKTGPLLDLFVELLWAFKHYEGPDLKEAIEEGILELLRPNQSLAILEQCKLRLLPLLKACREDDSGDIRNDFQVSYVFAIYSIPSANQAPQHSLNMIHEFFSQKEQPFADEEGRPSKRQRIGESHQRDPWELVYEDQVKTVTSLLADRSRTNVPGLSETAL